MKYLLITIIIVISIHTSANTVFAQPNPGNGSGGSPVGGAAPVGSGLICLICLGVSYGLVRSSKMKNK